VTVAIRRVPTLNAPVTSEKRLMRDFRWIAVIIVAVVVVSWSFFRPTVEQVPQPVAGDLTINGKTIARTLVSDRGRIYVSVPDLERAIDGDSHERLKLNGASLLAIADGSCKGCSLVVRRAVQISGNVRFFPNGPYIPLDDLVRALEARLDTTVHTNLNLYVGSCSWCILAPQEK
jgi:hypothetical protein